MKNPKKVIIDSDWGGDVFQMMTVMLAHPGEFEVLGASIVFGNANLEQNVVNAGAILKLLNAEHIPRYVGAAAPTGTTEQPTGDGAHGTTGLGQIELPLSDAPISDINSVDFILDTLKNEPAGTVTIFATGPQTNIAQAILKDPETMKRAKGITIMGGCVRPMTGYDASYNPDDGSFTRGSEISMQRQGNITPYAEFNFQQSPADAAIVLNSGLPIHLFPMDCTHQLTFTEERQMEIRRLFVSNPHLSNIVHGLLAAPKNVDRAKFDIDPVMHDVNTVISALHPQLYMGINGNVSVEVNPDADNFGQTTLTPSEKGNVWVAQSMDSPNVAFKTVSSALGSVFKQQRQPKATRDLTKP